MNRLALRALLRLGGWSAVGVLLLGGVVGGVATAGFAAADRTESAYQRFLSDTDAFDAVVTNGTNPENLNRQFSAAEIAELPAVAESGTFCYYWPFPGRSSQGRTFDNDNMSPLVPCGGGVGEEFNLLPTAQGRYPTGEFDVAPTPLLADALGLEVGDSLQLGLAPASGIGSATAPPADTFTVSGIVKMQAGFQPAGGGLPAPLIMSTRYLESHPGPAQIFAVRLHDGQQAVERFYGELNTLTTDPVVAGDRRDFAGVQRSLQVQAIALRIGALVIGVGGAFIVGPVLVRLGRRTAALNRSLRDLGAERRQQRSVVAAGAAVAGLAAGSVSAAVAVALSSLGPLGTARPIEVHPGLSIAGGVLALGTVAVVVLVVSVLVVAGLRTARETVDKSTSAGAARRGAALVGGPVAIVGRRLGFEPTTSRVRTVRASAVASTLVGSMLVVIVATLGAGISDLYRSPALYGWNWDIQVGDQFAGPIEEAAALYATRDGIGALAVASTDRLTIRGRTVDTFGVEQRVGSLEPVIVAGRAPARPDEILLGANTMRDVDADVGSTVEVSAGERSAAYRVVGRGVFPEFSGNAGLGRGAMVTLDGAKALRPGIAPSTMLVRVDSTPAGAAVLDELSTQTTWNVYLPTRPEDLANLSRISALPGTIAAILAVIAAIAQAFALHASVDLRRRDLAVLKALGLRPAQIGAAVYWHAVNLAVVGAVAGVTLGLVAGRLAWVWFAGRLGVPDRSAAPLSIASAVAVAALIACSATAAWAASSAARTRPALVLRRG